MSGGLRLLARLAGSLVALSLPRRPGIAEVSAVAEVIPFPAPRMPKAGKYAEEDCD